MRDTKVRSHCYVNKGQVLHLFTNFVNYGITISLTNNRKKQDKLV